MTERINEKHVERIAGVGPRKYAQKSDGCKEALRHVNVFQKFIYVAENKVHFYTS
jgi:hypothetical protein